MIKKSLILFVHGIGGSSKETWGIFPRLIAGDQELAAKYDVELDDYPSLPQLNPLRRSGGLDIAAEGLRTRIANVHQDYNRISLITHSQGGVIALRYILNELMERRILSVTSMLGYAVPFNGTTSASLLRSLGEQIEDLNPSSKFMFQLRKDWERSRGQIKVSIRAVMGGLDAIVAPASAIAMDPEYEVAHDHDHQTIVKPSSNKDVSFLIARRWLLRDDLRRASTNRTPIAVNARDHKRVLELAEQLSNVPDTNAWQPEWDSYRSEIETQMAAALNGGTPEEWHSITALGRKMRKIIRESAPDSDYLPPYLDKLSACTDAIEDILVGAANGIENSISAESTELLLEIDKTKATIDDERLALRQSTEIGASGQQQQSVEGLMDRLTKVEQELFQAKDILSKLSNVVQANRNTSSFFEAIDRAMRGLARGLRLLNDIRFSEKLRLTARTTWQAGARFAGIVRQKLQVFRLARHQEALSDEFEVSTPSFDGVSDSLDPTAEPSSDKEFRDDSWKIYGPLG